MVNLVYLCAIKSAEMKTQLTNVAQTLSGIANTVLTGAKSLKSVKLLLTTDLSKDKIGSYVIPLAKQLFRDNFMGSDLEMGMMLVFLKSYFLSATFLVSHNAIIDRFKELRRGKYAVTALQQEEFFGQQQVA